MATEIRETTITTDDGASIVRLHIADAPIGDDTAAFRLTLLAKLPRYKAPLSSRYNARRSFGLARF
jgi:hypothetical protein